MYFQGHILYTANLLFLYGKKGLLELPRWGVGLEGGGGGVILNKEYCPSL